MTLQWATTSEPAGTRAVNGAAAALTLRPTGPRLPAVWTRRPSQPKRQARDVAPVDFEPATTSHQAHEQRGERQCAEADQECSRSSRDGHTVGELGTDPRRHGHSARDVLGRFGKSCPADDHAGPGHHHVQRAAASMGLKCRSVGNPRRVAALAVN